MAMKVLVTDGGQRPALAIVRALGRCGTLLQSAATFLRKRAALVGPAPKAGSPMIPTAQLIPMVQGPPCLTPKI